MKMKIIKRVLKIEKKKMNSVALLFLRLKFGVVQQQDLFDIQLPFLIQHHNHHPSFCYNIW